MTGVTLVLIDPLTNGPLALVSTASGRYRLAEADSEGTLAATNPITDASGGFDLAVENLAPGRAVRLVADDDASRVEATVTGLDAAEGASRASWVG